MTLLTRSPLLRNLVPEAKPAWLLWHEYVHSECDEDGHSTKTRSEQGRCAQKQSQSLELDEGTGP